MLCIMDALYTRLLVEDFDAAIRFWEPALRDLLGIEPVKVIAEDGYAKWGLNDQTALVLFSRAALARAIGTDELPSRAAAQDAAMLAMHVTDVTDAARRLASHGASVVTEPQDRPEWSARLRTAHLRTPDGTLVELQSY
jgi:predicted enzyme related to lactoylglutathione lyase